MGLRLIRNSLNVPPGVVFGVFPPLLVRFLGFFPHSWCVAMVYCAALNCRNGSYGAYKNSSVTFYGFPLQNEPLLRQWIQNMGRDMETPSKYQRLCSEHFEESSFETDPLKGRKSRRLLKEAVPNKFILGEDGSWLVGTPQGFCGVGRNKTRKRIRNPERWRVIEGLESGNK